MREAGEKEEKEEKEEVGKEGGMRTRGMKNSLTL